MWAATGKVPHSSILLRIYEHCGDANCKQGTNKKCDPFLRLYQGCKLMMNENIDVPNGMANGTTCLLESVRLIQGANVEPMTVDGFWVNSVKMSDVESIQCKFDGGFRSGMFTLKPKTQTCTIQMPCTLVPGRDRMPATVKMTQLPVLINNATTGHKLQGKTLDMLFISHWNNAQNWSYVVLSRVRTLLGLYLRSPIPNHYVFTPPPAMIAMLLQFEENIRPWDFVRQEVQLV